MPGSARRRRSMGASSRPSHFRILSGVPGAAQLSEVLGVTRQPLAKLAPSAGRRVAVEHGDRVAALDQIPGGGDADQARADHDDPHRCAFSRA